MTIEFIPAICPQCGGELHLDSKQETGFCMHCGSKIVVQDAIRAVRLDNTHMIETWMKMGKSAAEVNNYEEAYKYFTKVIEVDINNWNALFLKGQAAGFLSTLSNPRVEELIGGINVANEIIEKSQIPNEEIVKNKNMFAMAIFELISGIDSLLFDKHIESLDKFLETDWDEMCDNRSWHIEEIKFLQKAISLIDGYTDEISIRNAVEIKQSIVTNCYWICHFEYFYLDFNKEELKYFGYTAKEKKPYIDLADQLIIEIRSIVPDYWKNDDYINRLDTPEKFDPHFEDKAIEVEKQVEPLRKQKLADYQKQKYWKEHPEEYEAYLAEEKMKKEKLEEEKNKLKSEINRKSIQLDDMKKNTDQEIAYLTNTRKKLGIFEISQKREIDQKIAELNIEIDDFGVGIQLMEKELNDLIKESISA